jgi:GNAT superfamily N-acetyltransferase
MKKPAAMRAFLIELKGAVVPFVIAPFDWPPPGFEALVCDARTEGWTFLDRMAAEWADGRNQFNRPGESIRGALLDGSVIGIAGLNRDPYVQDTATGRLRHVYVGPNWRRLGIAERLVPSLLAAPHGFRTICLRTANPEAARLYCALGFSPATETNATHRLIMPPPSIARSSIR